MIKWRPVKDAPLNGSFVAMRGPSGYMGTKYRLKMARYEALREDPEDFRESESFDRNAWRDHGGDHLTDDGEFPTEWCHLWELGLLDEPVKREPEHVAADGTVRKSHYGAGRQPWDDIVDAGWGPEFAAGNALKYVRRHAAKNGADDLEKGRWYFRRLQEMGPLHPIHEHDTDHDRRRIIQATRVLEKLMSMLTGGELTLLS